MKLTLKAAAVLRQLVDHAGQVVTKKEFFAGCVARHDRERYRTDLVYLRSCGRRYTIMPESRATSRPCIGGDSASSVK